MSHYLKGVSKVLRSLCSARAHGVPRSLENGQKFAPWSDPTWSTLIRQKWRNGCFVNRAEFQRAPPKISVAIKKKKMQGHHHSTALPGRGLTRAAGGGGWNINPVLYIRDCLKTISTQSFQYLIPYQFDVFYQNFKKIRREGFEKMVL